MSLKRRLEAIKRRLAEAGGTCRCGPCGIGIDVIWGEDLPLGSDGRPDVRAPTEPRICSDCGGERLVVLVLPDEQPGQRSPPVVRVD